MSSEEQRRELQAKIWEIANKVRGSVDGWDFKQYVLGTLFYRFISENFSSYMEGGDNSVNYAKFDENKITEKDKEDAIKTKGYFISPSQLFSSVAKDANKNESLNTDLASIFSAIENSANGYKSEPDIKGLFADFDTTSNRLGNTVKEKNKCLSAVIKGVEELKFGKFEDNQIDLFGDAYEFLISNYAANAGKSGGEFFTPQSVSTLIAKLAIHNKKEINKIYDPATGSGSLLLQAKKQFDDHIIKDGFYGQEINYTTYNLARMNMFLHNINYDKFNIALGDTLTDPKFQDDKPFDAIVSNPPYSINWIGNNDPTLINDDRFAPAGVLAPNSKADFAFVLHSLSYLSSKGRAAIVCFPGIFYRGGSEQKIRKYLIDNNFIETIISLAPNLFFGTSIAVNILILSKSKTSTKTQFIDASGFYKKETNNNVLTPEHIQEIIEIFDTKEDRDHISKSVEMDDIAKENYNLSVSSYVEAKDTREVVNIKELNTQIKQTVKKIDSLRVQIDKIVSEIEARDSLLTFGDEVSYFPLRKYVEFLNGKGHEKSIDEGGKYIVVNSKFISSDGNVRKYSNKQITPLFQYDILMVMSDLPNGKALAKCFFVDKNDTYTLNQRICSLTVKNRKEMDSRFLYCFLMRNRQLLKYDNGVDQTNLKKDQILDVLVPEISFAEQQRIVDILDRFDTLYNDILNGLTAEIEARKKQYEYYRDKLLNFAKTDAMA